MEDTHIYRMLLGMKLRWYVTKVQVYMALDRVDVWV